MDIVPAVIVVATVTAVVVATVVAVVVVVVVVVVSTVTAVVVATVAAVVVATVAAVVVVVVVVVATVTNDVVVSPDVDHVLEILIEMEGKVFKMVLFFNRLYMMFYSCTIRALIFITFFKISVATLKSML